MAIQIIHRGTHPKKRKFRTTCRVCKSILEFEAGDAKNHDSQREGPSWEVACPVCKGRVFADKKDEIKGEAPA